MSNYPPPGYSSNPAGYPPPGVNPSMGYPPPGYPPQGQGCPTPGQGYPQPPLPQVISIQQQPPPQTSKRTGCVEGCLAGICCVCCLEWCCG